MYGCLSVMFFDMLFEYHMLESSVCCYNNVHSSGNAFHVICTYVFAYSGTRALVILGADVGV